MRFFKRQRKERPAHLVLPRLARGGDTAVVLDGKDVTDGIRSVTVHADVDSVTTLTIEYNCYQVEVDGDPKVVHLCPIVEDAL